MTSDTRQFLAFVVFAGAWTGAAGLLLKLGIIHPLAIFGVWIVGFVWGVAYIAAGSKDADYLVKVWLGMIGFVVAIAGLAALVSMPFT